MGLRVENALLRSERNLLPSSAGEPTRMTELQGQIEALQKEVEHLKQRIEQLEK